MALGWRKIFGGSAPAQPPAVPARPAPGAMVGRPPAAKFAGNFPPELIAAITGGGTLAPAISRNEAMQVAAVMRARNLIAGSIGKLPLRVLGPDFREVIDTQYLVNTPPDPEIPQVVTMSMTVEDLMFYGVAWWRITKWGWHGYPVEARWVPHGSVLVAPSHGLPPSQLIISPDELFPTPDDGGIVYIDGRPVPDNEIIRFDSPNPPLLRHAARAIRTCLLLDQAAALYAVDPVPLGYFSPEDPGDPPEDGDVLDQLDQWAAARRTHAWPYLPAGLKANAVQWNPEQMQLAASRQHAVLDIARATGVDADYLEASAETGNSATYANSEDKRQDLIDFTCDPYLTAIQQRLSMRDCLPRGYCADFDITAFVRGDTASRMGNYKTGLEVGAYTKPEIRRLEKKPPLTPAELADSAPISPTKPVPATDIPAQDPTTQPPADGAQQERAPMGTQRFEAGGEKIRVQFHASSTQDFQVDEQRRTITGLLLPWGAVADNGFAKWRFAPDSVSWSDPSRVKLNFHHDSTELFAYATRLQSAQRGLMGTFKVDSSADGDKALQKAKDKILDGFSVEVDFEDYDSWQPDPTDETVRLVRMSTLRGVALTGTPAFDDARLTSVQASRPSSPTATYTITHTKGSNTMGTDPAGTMQAAAGQPDAAFDFDGFVTGLTESMKDTQTALVKSLGESVAESFSAGIKAALENIVSPQDGPQPVRAARYTITREAPVYSLNGAGPAMVRDAWFAVHHRDKDALERLWKFGKQTEDLSKLAHSEIQRQRFTTITTGNASQVIPPGYRPDLFVPMLAQGRPMVNAMSRGNLENATPFVVPVFGSVTGAAADNVEGTNPTDGTLTLTTKTVTPSAESGSLILSREIVDSANPAIDQIALNAMLEAYNQLTEAKVYTLLNGALGAGGTITSGFVPSGAQAATFAGTGGTPFPEASLIKGMRQQLAKYPFSRFASPNVALMGQNATSLIAGAMDSTGRPIFPSIGAMNASGVGNAVQQGWYIDGLPFIPAWAMTGVAAGDSQMLILNSLDGWVWESPLLTFRFEEKQGPAKIELDLFGYFATHLLRPKGLSGIRIT